MNRQKSLKRFSFTLIWVWGVLLLPCWFSLNNSETVKDVTVAFCSIQKLFIRDICVKFGIPNSPQSPDIDQNSDGGISIFSVTGEFFINENGHSSRTSHDIDMKLSPVTKLDERNTVTSKKNWSWRHVGNYNVILWQCLSDLWPICSYPGAGFQMHGL